MGKERAYKSHLVLVLLVLGIGLICCGTACTPQPGEAEGNMAENNEEKYEEIQFFMDTPITITVYSSNETQAQEALAAAFASYERIEQLTTRFRNAQNGSELSEVEQINNLAGIAPVTVGEDVFYILQQSLYFCSLSEGSFNPLVGPVMDLWGFGTAEQRLPEEKEIQALLPLLDWREIVLDAERKTVYLPRRGMALDLGGVAKGYAADLAAVALRDRGVDRAIINAGGNIYALGTRPDGRPWRVGIQDPRNSEEIVGIIEVSDRAVVSSGDYERFFLVDEQRYHHIIDPDSGRPADGLWQTTIVSESAMEADILSTAVFVLGVEKGNSLLEERQLGGVLVAEDGGIHVRQSAAVGVHLVEREGYFIHALKD